MSQNKSHTSHFGLFQHLIYHPTPFMLIILSHSSPQPTAPFILLVDILNHILSSHSLFSPPAYSLHPSLCRVLPLRCYSSTVSPLYTHFPLSLSCFPPLHCYPSTPSLPTQPHSLPSRG
ncbi:unnamed protein product [Cuscuta europaea]|uniref:Uncharacterized protein n=1 Tax=Cuscuta europaea TaxID=41803 RepID=A0A9P0YI64_CUSEU|nr:unnamed protein product [Cuscuta europaea]